MDEQNDETTITKFEIPSTGLWDWTKENQDMVKLLIDKLESQSYIVVNDFLTFAVFLVDRSGKATKYRMKVSLKKNEDTMSHSQIDFVEDGHYIFTLLENLEVVYYGSSKLTLDKEARGYSCILELTFGGRKQQPQPTLEDQAEENSEEVEEKEEASNSEEPASDGEATQEDN